MDKKIVEYKILKEDDHRELSTSVNEYIKNWRQPTWGVSISLRTQWKNWYAQAMVKYE